MTIYGEFTSGKSWISSSMENLNVGIGFVYGALIIAIYKIWYMINF
jgi:hypothetical protein